MPCWPGQLFYPWNFPICFSCVFPRLNFSRNFPLAVIKPKPRSEHKKWSGKSTCKTFSITRNIYGYHAEAAAKTGPPMNGMPRSWPRGAKGTRATRATRTTETHTKSPPQVPSKAHRTENTAQQIQILATTAEESAKLL